MGNQRTEKSEELKLLYYLRIYGDAASPSQIGTFASLYLVPNTTSKNLTTSSSTCLLPPP